MSLCGLLSAFLAYPYVLQAKPLFKAELPANWVSERAAPWNPDWTSGELEAQKIVPLGNGKNALRMRYKKDETSKGGMQVAADLSDSEARSRSELFLGYHLKLDPDFDFKIGGKLPGFASQNTGGGDRPVNGFSTRNMWREGGEFVLYLYVPKQKNYGENVKHPYGLDIPYKAKLTPGKWQYLVQRVRLNTPGKADGIFEGWIDGEKKVSLDNIMYRRSWQTYPIELFWFSTFFGGSGPEWEPSTHQYAEFSEFVVADSYPEPDPWFAKQGK